MIVWTLLSMSFAVVIDEMQIRTSIVIWYVMLNQYKKFSHLTFIHKCMHCCHGFHGWTINFAHSLPHLAKNFVSVKKKQKQTNKQNHTHTNHRAKFVRLLADGFLTWSHEIHLAQFCRKTIYLGVLLLLQAPQ